MTTIKRFTPDYKMHAVRFEAFAREAEHGEYQTVRKFIMQMHETPATSAALAAIEARGAERFAAWASEQESMASDSGDKKEARIYCQVAARAKHFAKQLREAK